MKKKIKIKINGKINKIDDKTKLSYLVKNLKVPLKNSSPCLSSQLSPSNFQELSIKVPIL